MTYLELAVVMMVALLVLGPQEFKRLAFLFGKAWQTVQAAKALLHQHLMSDNTKSSSHRPHE